jgi:hypothetical protein
MRYKSRDLFPPRDWYEVDPESKLRIIWSAYEYLINYERKSSTFSLARVPEYALFSKIISRELRKCALMTELLTDEKFQNLMKNLKDERDYLPILKEYVEKENKKYKEEVQNLHTIDEIRSEFGIENILPNCNHLQHLLAGAEVLYQTSVAGIGKGLVHKFDRGIPRESITSLDVQSSRVPYKKFEEIYQELDPYRYLSDGYEEGISLKEMEITIPKIDLDKKELTDYMKELQNVLYTLGELCGYAKQPIENVLNAEIRRLEVHSDLTKVFFKFLERKTFSKEKAFVL